MSSQSTRFDWQALSLYVPDDWTNAGFRRKKKENEVLLIFLLLIFWGGKHNKCVWDSRAHTDGSMVMRCTFPASCLSPWVYQNSKELTGNVGLCVCVRIHTHFKLGFFFRFCCCCNWCGFPFSLIILPVAGREKGEPNLKAISLTVGLVCIHIFFNFLIKPNDENKFFYKSWKTQIRFFCLFFLFHFPFCCCCFFPTFFTTLHRHFPIMPSCGVTVTFPSGALTFPLTYPQLLYTT
jgi:hypothetical protein